MCANVWECWRVLRVWAEATTTVYDFAFSAMEPHTFGLFSVWLQQKAHFGLEKNSETISMIK